MHPNHKRPLVPLTIAIMLVAAPSTGLARQHHQLKLNRELIAAIKQSDPAMVDSLLAAGADPNTRDRPVKNESGLQRLYDLIHQPSPYLSPTALMLAVEQCGQIDHLHPRVSEIVTKLLMNGANPNEYVDILGAWPPGSILMTPLTRATLNNSRECVRILLYHGANPNARSSMLDTPLHWARLNDLSGLITLLKSHGATE